MNHKKLLLVGTLLSYSTLLFGAEGGKGQFVVPDASPAGADQVETMVKIQTSDGKIFEVPLSIAKKSRVLKGILFVSGGVVEGLVIPLENIDAETFTFIVDWLGEVLSVEDEADTKERAQGILIEKLFAIMKGVEDLQLKVDRVVKIALALDFLDFFYDLQFRINKLMLKFLGPAPLSGEQLVSATASWVIAGIIKKHAGKILDGSLNFEQFGNRFVDGGRIPKILMQILSKRFPYYKKHIFAIEEMPLVVAVSSDGQYIVSGSSDGKVIIRNLATGECERVLEGHINAINSVAVSSDGQYIVSGSLDKTVRVWNLTTGQCERVLEGHINAINSVAVSSDGQYIVSGSLDRTVRVWDLATGQCERVLEGHTDAINSVAVSPDGLIVSGSNDRTVRVWNLITGECERVLKGHTDAINSVAVSPDGLIVSGSNDRTVRVWNLITEQCEGELEGHTDAINSVAVSPDGLIVSGSDDGTVRVWNLTKAECQILDKQLYQVKIVAISPDGRIIFLPLDKNVQVWSNILSELTAQQAVILFAILESTTLPLAGSSAHIVYMKIPEDIRNRFEIGDLFADQFTTPESKFIDNILKNKKLPSAETPEYALWMSLSQAKRNEVEALLALQASREAAPAARPQVERLFR